MTDGATPRRARSERVPSAVRKATGEAGPVRPDLWNRAVDAWFRTREWEQELRCPHCGYDLRALPAPGGFLRCPECGTRTERYKAVVLEARPAARWKRWRWPALAAALLAAAMLVLVYDGTYGFALPIVIVVLVVGYLTRGQSFDVTRPLSRGSPPLHSPGAPRTDKDRALSETLQTRPDEPEG